MLRLLLAALAVLAVAPVHAQHDHPAGSSADGPAALTADEADGLRAGRGLGMALAAEANHYPGPLHVMELADSLGLSLRQRAQTEALRAEMLHEAVPLGEQIIEVERHLDALFASGEATPEAVDRMTAQAASLRGRLRAVHLLAHVAMHAALTSGQIATYDRLRGH